MQVKTALLSVSFKKGIVNLARELQVRGIKILSTGGTAQLLEDDNIEVTRVSKYTKYPEMLGGRVKTLHPKIHAGLLARRDVEKDMKQLKKKRILPIDLVVCNLYPFEEIVSQKGVTLREALEKIDIGGVTIIRAGAKNFPGVLVVIDPEDYDSVIKLLKLGKGNNDIPNKVSLKLAKKAFDHTCTYDKRISEFLEEKGEKVLPPLEEIINYLIN